MLTRRVFLAGSLGALLPAVAVQPLNAAQNPSFRITPKPSKAYLLEDQAAETAVWAYDGLVPGPAIHAKKGEEISIEVKNLLEQPTTVHWHGIRIDNAMDGVAGLTQAPIQPGESFTYRFTPPDAGTYWYHPHNRTWEQLARGLYGTLIVEGDAAKADFDRDYSIVADDWRLENHGSIHEASFRSMHDWSHAGRLGNILTLNGKPYERLDVIPGERVRLRFVNTSNARVMKFALADHETILVALDGQPVQPVGLGNEGITLAPAQRADLMVDIEGQVGDEIAILETSSAESLVAGYLVCRSGTDSRSSDRGPVKLVSNTIPDPDLSKARVIELVMSGGAMRFLTSASYKGKILDGRSLAREHQQVWAFNGVAGMSDKPLFSVAQGETVKINMVNDTAWPHAIHLHGHHFRILSRKRGTIQKEDYEIGTFRDTVLLDRDEMVEISLVVDNPGKWMVHCHMLEHQAAGMATWFEVSQ
ncbi:MAG: multicopper oxidase family protein [Rhizobiaceae bacterium]